MTKGQIEWTQKNPQQPEEGITTTLTVTCLPNGACHMETPQSQGGFTADYASPQEAAQGFAALFEEGRKRAGELS